MRADKARLYEEATAMRERGERGYGRVSAAANALLVRLAYHRWEVVRRTRGRVFMVTECLGGFDTRVEAEAKLATLTPE